MVEGDAELVAQSLSGNRGAYGELVRRHVAWVGAAAAGVLGDLTVACDVVCESFRRAYVSLANLPDRRSFCPWLYTITQRTALDWLRHHQESQDTSAMRPVGEGRADERLRLLAEVLALPPHFREAILLHHVGGRSAAEIADLTGGVAADAESRLRRAEQALAQRQTDPARVAEALRQHPFGGELAEATIRQLPAFAQEATDPALRTRVARYQRRALAIGVLAAALAAAALVVVVLTLIRRKPAVAHRERTEGPVQLEGHLAAGSWVRTPLGSSVALRLSDGSRVIVRGNSSLLLQQPRRLYLARGDIWLKAKDSHEPFEISAPVGGVTCRGAELVVRSSDEITRVAVRAGGARLHGGQGTAAVVAGQVALTAEGRGPAVVEGAAAEALFAWVDGFLARTGREPVASGRPPPSSPTPAAGKAPPVPASGR